MANSKHTRWLQREMPHWVQQQLISHEQADNIAQYYQQQTGGSSRSVFSAIGAILFGLGIILFFAYNWQEMHRYLKLLVIFSFIIGSNLAAIWFNAPPRQQRAASEGMALLGTLLFGSGIWLISQIYHIDEHYPNAFFFWGLAAIAMGWARQSALQCLMAISLIFTWGCMEIFSFGINFHSSPWWLLLGTTPLAWRLRSAPLLFLSIATFLGLWVIDLYDELEAVAAYLTLTLAVLLIQLSTLIERLQLAADWSLRTALLLPGFLVYMAFVFTLTFVHFAPQSYPLHLFDTPLRSAFFWASMLISIALPAINLLPILPIANSSTNENDTMHTVLIGITVLLVFFAGPGWLSLSYGMLSGIMNLIFIGHCLLFIWHGSQQQNGREVSAGCLLLAVLIFARYSDLFDSLLSRALVFVILGASLFVVGNFYSRQKNSDTNTVGETA